jgi:beta-glucosidase/6-phospho-beta-glucosidase/beta-galactosidase
VITENGCAVAEDDVDEALKDIERAVYLKRYLTEVGRQLRLQSQRLNPKGP